MPYSEKKSAIPIIVGIVLSILCLSSIGLYFLNKAPDAPKKQQRRTRQRALTVPTPPLSESDEHLISDNTPYKIEKGLNPSAATYANKQHKSATEKDDNSAVAFNHENLPPLTASDSDFRQDVVGISEKLTFLLLDKDYIRLSMSIINDLAQGLRPPLKLLRKFKLSGEFTVEKRQGKFYMSTASYARYDALADAINSINIPKTVLIFKKYQPLFDEVFQEYAYPEVYSVLDIIQSAVSKLLQVPIIEGEIALIHPTIRYHFADKKLERLSALDKQMLRMGPENTRIIQHKLRQLIQAFVADIGE